MLIMASNQLVDFDFTADYFNFTKICFLCRKDHKTFKIPLAAYDYDGQCKLTVEEKKRFSFVCRSCRWINELDFIKICNEQTAKVLNRRVDFVMQEVEKRRKEHEFYLKKNELQKEFLKLKLTELDKHFLFL